MLEDLGSSLSSSMKQTLFSFGFSSPRPKHGSCQMSASSLRLQRS